MPGERAAFRYFKVRPWGFNVGQGYLFVARDLLLLAIWAFFAFLLVDEQSALFLVYSCL
jgi:hypothetical protein